MQKDNNVQTFPLTTITYVISSDFPQYINGKPVKELLVKEFSPKYVQLVSGGSSVYLL